MSFSTLKIAKNSNDIPKYFLINSKLIPKCFFLFHFSLPEEIIWFEPPTVCRWESLAETEVSEKIENKPTTSQLTKQRSIKNVSQKQQKSEVSIVDFNLLRIPPKIDINFIIQEIIVPRLPDGYTIVLSEPKIRRNQSQALFSVETQTDKKKTVEIESTEDFLVPTNSPRSLHPKRRLKFDVKIIERKDNGQSFGGKEYMFSKLLQELEDLNNKQQPQIQKQMDELSEILSVSLPDEQTSDQGDIEPTGDDLLFKADDFAWNINKKPEVAPEVIEPVAEESEDDEESDEEE